MLNVRISHKYDTLENWKSSTIVLNPGELAIAEIPTDTTGSGLTPPAIGVKVGDGSKTFNELNWIQSTAGDVYAWAKAPDKPVYKASEISGLHEYIAGEIQDSNTNYRFSYTNDILTVESKEKTSEEWTKVIDIPITLSSKIDKVTGAVAGNLPQLAADGSLIDSGKKISDYATTASLSDYVKSEQFSSLEETVTGLDTKIGDTETALDELQESFETLNGDATTEGSVKKQVADAVAGIVNGAPEAYNTLKEMSDWIATHQGDATAMNSAILQNSNDINALEEDAHDHENKTVLDGITVDKVTNWDGAVQTVGGLTTTKEGTKVTVTAIPANLLANVEGETLTLNCGTSNTVI